MIEQHFEVTKVAGCATEAVITARCRGCQHTFDANTFILGPQNCRHELGMSFTLICPGCKIEATTTERESVIAAHEKYLEKLCQAWQAASGLEEFQCRFNDMNTLICRCQHWFTYDSATGSNCAQRNNGDVLIRCPACGVSDELTSQAVEVLSEIAKLTKRTKCTLIELQSVPRDARLESPFSQETSL